MEHIIVLNPEHIIASSRKHRSIALWPDFEHNLPRPSGGEGKGEIE